MIYDYIIIGGGISGLYLLDELKINYPKFNNGILLERSSILGGRMKTEYDKNGKVLLEKGPWRFHETHSKLLKLINRLKLKYIINSSSNKNTTIFSYDTCKKNKKTKKKI